MNYNAEYKANRMSHSHGRITGPEYANTVRNAGMGVTKGGVSTCTNDTRCVLARVSFTSAEEYYVAVELPTRRCTPTHVK